MGSGKGQQLGRIDRSHQMRRAEPPPNGNKMKTIRIQPVYTCNLLPKLIKPKKELAIDLKNLTKTKYNDVTSPKCVYLKMLIMNHPLINEEMNQLKFMTGLEIMKKYFRNIFLKPEEEKFRTIRFENEQYKKSVIPLLEHNNMMMLAGFRLHEGDKGVVWRMTDDTMNVETLKEFLRYMDDDNYLIKFQIHHNTQLRPADDVPKAQIGKEDLSDDFFNLSYEEIVREQKTRAKAVEEMGRLKTKNMREKEKEANRRYYPIAYIRVRVVLDNILHYYDGIFEAETTIRKIGDWINRMFKDPSRHDFSIAGPNNRILDMNSDQTLSDFRMPPASILTISTAKLKRSDIRDRILYAEQINMS
ncbi:hypothetical protein SNEBB_009072 [Seison nebaliae]|nr:hypothetical protein SNEBB_009072 [Seison nebaliae]